MLRLILGASPAILDELLRFECDVGVVGYRPDDARYHSLRYDRHRILVVMSTRHRLARLRRLRLEHLQGQDMILRAEGSTTRASFDAVLAKNGVAVRPVMETNSREAVLRAAASGIGLGVITETEFVAMSGIKAMTIDDAAMFTHAHVVCLAERRTRPLISAFLDLAAARARNARAAR
jgi:DNA-binding transcriptional LysR family regulator